MASTHWSEMFLDGVRVRESLKETVGELETLNIGELQTKEYHMNQLS